MEVFPAMWFTVFSPDRGIVCVLIFSTRAGYLTFSLAHYSHFERFSHNDCELMLNIKQPQPIVFTFRPRCARVRAAGTTCLEERKTETCGFNVEEARSSDLHAAWRRWKHTSGWKAVQHTHPHTLTHSSSQKSQVCIEVWVQLLHARGWDIQPKPCRADNDFNMLPFSVLADQCWSELFLYTFSGRCTYTHRMHLLSK